MSATKPPLGLMPEWRHKELRLQEIREAIERYLGAKEAIPVNWIAEEYALRTWLENREESKKELTSDTPAPEQTTKEGLWSDEDMVEFANQYHWSSTRITLDKFKASKQSLFNTPKQEQSSKDRDWEIVSYKSRWGGDDVYTRGTSVFGRADIDHHIIHSVRRISDNEVFSVGDEVDRRPGTGKIYGFQILGNWNGGMRVYFDINKDHGSAITQIQKLPSTKPSEQPTKERMSVMHLREQKNAFVHFGGNHSYVMETWGLIPEEKFPLIKEAIENIINHKNK